MSVEAITAVWWYSESSGSDLLVLLAMADWSDHQGRCYPSYNQIAEKARVSRATAFAAVKRLEAKGEIGRVVQGHAPEADDQDKGPVKAQWRNQYKILLIQRLKGVQDLDHPKEAQGVQVSDPGGLNAGRKGVQTARTHIRNRPSGSTVSRPSAASALSEREVFAAKQVRFRLGWKPGECGHTPACRSEKACLRRLAVMSSNGGRR